MSLAFGLLPTDMIGSVAGVPLDLLQEYHLEPESHRNQREQQPDSLPDPSAAKALVKSTHVLTAAIDSVRTIGCVYKPN